MQVIYLKIRYFERGLFKSLEGQLYFFFQTQSLLMDKIIKKQKRPETSDQSLFRLQNRFRKIPILLIYYLNKFDDVIREVFGKFQKLHLLTYACHPIHDIISYFLIMCLFEFRMCGKERKKI